MTEGESLNVSRQMRFVQAIISEGEKNKGLVAKLKRAHNPNTEYQSWDFLARFGIDLEKEYERAPYAFVASMLANERELGNGSLSLGKAIRSCYEGDASDKGPGSARIRRLLACKTVKEACQVLRPIVRLIQSKNYKINFVELLEQLSYFNLDSQRIKVKWAQAFFNTSEDSISGNLAEQ